jgi:hypothetical protein
MKKIYFAVAIAFFCMKPAYSQFCGTPVDTNYSHIDTGPYPEHLDTFYIRVYPHAVRDNNGDGGHPVSYIKEAMCILKRDFAPYNIFFDFQPINFIHNTQLLDIERPNHDSLWPLFDAFMAPFVNNDGIDMFFIGDPHDTLKGSFARRVGSKSMYIGGSFGDYIPHSTTSAVTHEMGHCFGLYHTFMGSGSSYCNFYSGPFTGGPCAELVDGSDCNTCGDYICDTPADPGVYRVTEQTCYTLPSLWFAHDSIITYDCQYNWNYVNGVYITDSSATSRKYVYDANDDPYNPDMTNYMAYTYARCMQNFSPDQYQKMIYMINNSIHLNGVQSTQENFPYGTDLVVRTALDDYGDEPYLKSSKLWKSPDIWVRNQPDGFQNHVHQNPRYDSVNNNPVYVYVRVSNHGCEDFNGSGHLKLYWSKASTALSWPGHWINAFQSGIPFGNFIDSLPLSTVPAWHDNIYQFEWHPEDPTQYVGINNEPWHSCLLARIVTNDDPMTVPEMSSIYINISNNNNIAMKNVTIVYPPNDLAYSPGGVVAIGSVTEEDEETYTITFKTHGVNDHFLTEEAEVSFILDETSWQKWDEGGRLGYKIEIADEGMRKIAIQDDGAYLDGLTFSPMERSTLMLAFNFLVDEVSNTEEFECDLIQSVSGGEQEIIGGETYIITKDINRMPFAADAGYEQMILTGDSVLLEAGDIGEEAIYNWYLNDTVKVHTGRQFLSYPEKTGRYKLEVIARDGYKDYDSTKVEVKQFSITGISPNPADNEVNISYRIKHNSNAQLVILRSNGVEMVNQSLLSTNATVTINVSHFPVGTYTAVIRTGNQNVDSKIFVVQ